MFWGGISSELVLYIFERHVILSESASFISENGLNAA